jgi:hypothetical protein
MMWSQFLLLALLLSQDEIVARAPSTGEAPAKLIIKRSDGSLDLVEADKAGEMRTLAHVGQIVNVSNRAIAKIIPSNRPITKLESLHLPNAEWKIISTTGLRPDPSSSDAYTGKPLYERQDDLLFLQRTNGTYKTVRKESFNEIYSLELVQFSNRSAPFIVASTFEGQHNSLLRIFRVTRSNSVRPVKLPEPELDGRWQEKVVEENGSKFILLSVEEPGSFPEAPGKKSKTVTQMLGWNDEMQSFRRLSEVVRYQ